MSDTLLNTVDLSKFYGALAALNGLEINVKEGQIHGLIGPNGAGKTTFVNMISGFQTATKGNCYFDGKDITHQSPHLIAKMGLTRTFQQGQIFPQMTCLQNVMVGAHHKIRTGYLKTIFKPPFIKSHDEIDVRNRALDLLKFVELINEANRPVADLTWVECQLLQIARALASSPKLLVMDEPSAGMGFEESRKMATLIKQIREIGITVILISHDMQLVMDVADWITVINFGEKISEGLPGDVRNDPQVLEAYLGEENT